jgi:hypothetical protein
VGQGRESVQKEFTVNAIKGTTNFTETGLQYSTAVLKVNTNSYAPGGRVAS